MLSHDLIYKKTYYVTYSNSTVNLDDLEYIIIPPKMHLQLNFLGKKLIKNIKVIIANDENINNIRRYLKGEYPAASYEHIIFFPYFSDSVSLTFLRMYETIYNENENNKLDILKIKQQIEELNSNYTINISDIRKKKIEINKEISISIKSIKEKEKKFQNTLDVLNDLMYALENCLDENSKLYQEINRKINKLIENKSKQITAEYNDLKVELKKLLDKEMLEEKKSEIEKYYKEIESSTINKINSLHGKIDKYFENSKNELEKLKVDVDDLADKIAKKAIEKVREVSPYKNVYIVINDVENYKKNIKLIHKKFEDVVKLLSLGMHPLLVGPAGCGKNVILEQAAEALELKFYYVNDVTEEYKVMGFVDANGKYQETQFFKAFTQGGLMMIDEMDNSHSSALLSINAAIGTGYNSYLSFPDGNFYKKHDNFHLAAAANTYGNGSDMIYCGRSSLDGASLNRFSTVYIDYDRTLEENLISKTEILPLYWEIRESINKNKIRHVISTRNIVNADKLLMSKLFDIESVFEYTLIQGLTDDDLRIILNDISKTKSNTIKNKFVDYLRKNKNIDLKEYNNCDSSYDYDNFIKRI